MNRKISRGGKIIIYLVLLLVAFVMVVPFAWMILTAFKTQSESTQMNPFLIFPTAFRTEAFVQAWEELNFGRLYLNTFAMIFIRIITCVVTSDMAGYAFRDLNSKAVNLLSDWSCFR